MNTNKQETIRVVSSNEEMVSCSNGEKHIDVTIDNFQDICRFCLFGPAELNLFRMEYNKLPFYICMAQFSIKITLNDELPVNICKKCENKIRDFSNFRTSLLNVEHILKGILQNKHSCNTEVTDIDVFETISHNNSDDTNVSMQSSSKDKTFKNTIDYKKHLKEQQEIKKEQFSSCKICEKLFTKRKLATHMKIHFKIKEPQNFQCNMCGKNYKTKRNLSRHYLTHDGMPHVCKICGKGFREANLLTDHLNIHNGISPYLCGQCGKSYATSSALRLHRSYNHTGVKRKNYKYPKRTENRPVKKPLKGSFPCEICGKVYSSRTTVNYHVLTHSDEKKFQCNDCGKMFANRSILGDHRRIHRLSYKCTYCDRSFAYAASLETHINSHTGEKPHSCNVCGKRYSNRSHLKEHMRNHTGERPYSCTICGKTFAVKGNLNTHLKTHIKNRTGT